MTDKATNTSKAPKAPDTNKAINDATSDAQDKLHDVQGRASDVQGSMRDKAAGMQHDVRDRVTGMQSDVLVHVHELRDKAEAKAHEVAGDAPAKVQVQTTRVLERAERTPDVVYLGVVGASMAMSALLLLSKRRGMSLFVGLWPVTILNIAMLLKSRHPSQEIGTAASHGRSGSTAPGITTEASSAGIGGELMAE